MKLTPKGKKRQATIAQALKKGLPLAGLLSSLLMTTGCDWFRAVLPRQTVGDVPMQKPSQVTSSEQPEEPNAQPTQNQLPDTPAEEKSNASCDSFRAVLPRQIMGDVPIQLPDTPAEEKNKNSEPQSLGSQISTGDPQLPIITIFNDEQKDKILEIINPDTITDPSKLKPRANDPMKQINE